MKKLFFLLVLTIGVVFQNFGQSHKYYVANSGNDKNDGTVGKPFKTIQKAASLLNAGDSCIIRGGTYRETIIPTQSGLTGKPIVFMAYPSENVIVSGSDIVSSKWKTYKGDIYKTYMPWTMGLGKDMVFIDGKLVVQARHPNTRAKGAMAMPPVTEVLSPLWPTAFGNFEVTSGSEIIKSPTDLNQEQKDYWKGALYLGFHKWSWCMQTAQVASSSKGQFTFANPTKMWWFPDDADFKDYAHIWDSIQNGYLTNHIHALDQSGEWHWQNDTLYLWTNKSTSPAKMLVEAKKRQLAFDLRNRNYIDLKNLSVIASSVNLYNANNCTVAGCKLSYISHFQQWADGREGIIDGIKSLEGALFKGEVGIIVGGTDNAFKNCIIEYSSGAGLYLNGNRTTVTNCIIHDCGYTSTYLGCIFIFNDHLNPGKQCGGHTITHCNLYNAGRAVVSVFGNEKNQTIFDPMEICYNQIHDGCILGNDGGLFNSWKVTMGTNDKKTEIHHNLIWDQWGQFWAGIVYPDNESYNMNAHHNVIWYSEKNKYDLKDRRIWKGNLPNNCCYSDNVEKRKYTGGVTGLTEEDYPGGIFKTGASFGVNTNGYLIQAK